jgi:glycosyltransferase involved in cell wall biosynthesis
MKKHISMEVKESLLKSSIDIPSASLPMGEGGLRTKGCFKKSFEGKPLVSVITVVFNGQKHLEQTIQSVLSQSYDNVEYIIIDGGSTDGTIDIIRKYEHAIDYWVSEKDHGIYDAMNKGIAYCSGDLIGIINSDDWYDKKTLEEAVRAFLAAPGASLFHGDLFRVEQANGILFRKKPLPVAWPLKYMAINHPATFIRADCYRKSGGYDTAFSLCADFELLCRIVAEGRGLRYYRGIVAYMRSGGATDRISRLSKRCIEGYKIRKRYGYPPVSNFIRSCVMFLACGFKGLLKNMLSRMGMKCMLEFWYRNFRPHICMTDGDRQF